MDPDHLLPSLQSIIQNTVKEALGSLHIPSVGSKEPADMPIKKNKLKHVACEPTEIISTSSTSSWMSPTQVMEQDSTYTVVEQDNTIDEHPVSVGSIEPADITVSTSSIELAETTLVAFPAWTEQQALNAMQNVLKKPDATWTSAVQRDSVMAILNSTQDILTIATTGSGKSMLPIIPSILETNCITVLILPLKSLITDYQRKLKEMAVPFLHYSGRHIPRGFCTPNLVLVSVDMAREQHWEQWIAEIDSIKAVKRFCFDEGQYPLTDSNFRPALRDVYMVRTLPRQLVIFSGTLSPLCEPKIKELFLLSSNVQVFRTPSTNRPELQLIRALPQKRKELADIVGQLWGMHGSTFSTEDRALVFVPWIDLGQEIARKLNCEFYNSKDKDSIKEGIFSRWRADGNCNIMVSTSAFSCGNDYAHVRLIIHAGTPRQMMGYIQEVSRGGRDHKAAHCYLIPTTAWSSASSTELDAFLGVAEMKEMAFGSCACLRYTTTLYNDGQGLACAASADNLPCSVCLPTAGLMPKLFVPSCGNPLKRKATSSSIEFPPSKHICLTPSAPSTLVKPLIFPPTMPAASTSASSSVDKMYAIIQERKMAKQKEDAEVMCHLQGHLDLLSHQCVMCHWYQKLTGERIMDKPHEFKHCPFLKTSNGADYIAWKNTIQYNSKIHSKICYICHIPNFGDRLHGPFTGPGGCQYLDIVLPTLYLAFHYQKPYLEEAFGVHWSALAQYTSWLCGKLVDEKQKSNLISAFIVCAKVMK